jgi:excisionase family DNA binding protein
VEIEPPAANLATDYAGHQESLGGLRFGGKYLVAREQLAALIDQRQNSINQPIDSAVAAPEPQVKREKPESELPVSAPAPAETAGSGRAELLPDEESFLKFISRHPGLFVTKIYKALKLSGYKGNKLKKSLIDKGLIVQEKTREGHQGRLAKILSLTDKGAAAARKLFPRGKGGFDHTELQEAIKEQAELFGWRGITEKRIPRSLESVDVELRKDDLVVAVEISTTTKPQHEVQNIRKCLEAGYDYILAVCSDSKRLSELKTEVKRSFSFKERERIRFYPHTEVKTFFHSIGPRPIVSEKGIVSGQITKQKEVLNSEEAATFLGISRNTLYEWIVQKKIPHIKVGRLLKFNRSHLEKWLEKRFQNVEESDIFDDQ